jgi:hypothetical protein
LPFSVHPNAFPEVSLRAGRLACELIMTTQAAMRCGTAQRAKTGNLVLREQNSVKSYLQVGIAEIAIRKPGHALMIK